MKAVAPRRVHVVVHTHWDREWYFTQETFRARLVEVARRVADQLESGALPSFLLDGQVGAYDDLLSAAEPALVRRVESLVRLGRLAIGPWLVMADEFLVSGESLWRNLEAGRTAARAHGATQAVGYLPDTFGHVAQMPQLLAQFGIGSAAVWRGADAPQTPFEWVAPDGTSVPVLYLAQGYYQIPLHDPQWHAALERFLVDAERLAPEGPLLLMHGGDHLAPQPDLKDKIAAFNAAQSRWVLEFATLDSHAAALLAAVPHRPAITGELRSNTNAFVLPDVLSTRRHLKRQHQEVEDRLTGEIEPLLAQCCAVDALPAAYLHDTWRRLLNLQAHDSICGCSTDAVHAAMDTEFAHMRDRLDALRDIALASGGLVSRDMCGPGDVFADDRLCTVFNPLPKEATGVHVVEIFLEGAAREPARAMQVKDRDGREWPCAVLGARPAHRFRSPFDGFPDRRAGHVYEIALQGRVAGLGANALDLSPVALRTLPPRGKALENAALSVGLDAQGHLTLTDRRDGSVMHRVLDLMSELDAGDTYNFSPPSMPRTTRGVCWSLCGQADHGLVREWTLKTTLNLPAGLDAARQGSSADTVTCEGELRLRLLGDEPFVDARLEWTNRAKDQRTRLLFPVDAALTCTASDSAFAWIERPVALADIPAAPSRREMPVVVMPSLSAIVAGPFGFCHRGMQEYEVMDLEGDRHLGVTLVRSVDWLSRRDLVTRGVGAGPDIETPGAQCLMRDAFEFRFGRVAPGPEGADPWRQMAERFRKPVRIYTGQAPGWRAPVDIGHSALMVSAVRAVSTPEPELEIRVWNPCADVQSVQLVPGAWRRSSADGNVQAWSAEVAPHGIATFRRTWA